MHGTTTTLCNFRVSQAQLGTIQRAARLSGLTMSDLIRAAALERAAKVLGEKT